MCKLHTVKYWRRNIILVNRTDGWQRASHGLSSPGLLMDELKIILKIIWQNIIFCQNSIFSKVLLEANHQQNILILYLLSIWLRTNMAKVTIPQNPAGTVLLLWNNLSSLCLPCDASPVMQFHQWPWEATKTPVQSKKRLTAVKTSCWLSDISTCEFKPT